MLGSEIADTCFLFLCTFALTIYVSSKLFGWALLYKESPWSILCMLAALFTFVLGIVILLVMMFTSFIGPASWGPSVYKNGTWYYPAPTKGNK